jgi:hypothetical protein
MKTPSASSDRINPIVTAPISSIAHFNPDPAGAPISSPAPAGCGRQQVQYPEQLTGIERPDAVAKSIAPFSMGRKERRGRDARPCRGPSAGAARRGHRPRRVTTPAQRDALGYAGWR